MSGVKISVCCFTYNHVAYISRALDSVLAQNTNFKYEVIIGDDCSNDGSQDIIKRYATQYPNVIKAIFQPVNSRAKKNIQDVYNAAQGEYIIVLETDDYWLDNNKLQIQSDFLDNHPDFIAVAHNCIVVNKNEELLNKKYKAISKGEYNYKHFMRGLLPGQTTTILYRNPRLLSNIDMSLYEQIKIGPGDLKKIFCLMTGGKIETLPYIMSAYRYVTIGGNSFSSNHKRDDKSALELYRAFQDYSRKFNNVSMRLAADVLLLQTALGAWKNKQIENYVLISYCRLCESPFKTLFNSFLNIFKNKFCKN